MDGLVRNLCTYLVAFWLLAEMTEGLDADLMMVLV